MSRKFHTAISIVVGILVVLVILKMSLASRAMTNLLPGSITTKEPMDPYIDEIKAYQDELKRTDLSSATRNLIEEKLSTISMMATQRAKRGATQPIIRQASMQATPTIEVAGMRLPDGIDNHPSVPFSESVVTVLNSWRKTTDNRYYLVYAGFLTQDSQQGAILVFHPSTHGFKQYNTPENSGGVRVVEEKGTTITLQSAKGILFYFDVAREQFGDLKGVPIPTNTPMAPTPTTIISFTLTPVLAYP
jgi:hypothetical protein